MLIGKAIKNTREKRINKSNPTIIIAGKTNIQRVKLRSLTILLLPSFLQDWARAFQLTSPPIF